MCATSVLSEDPFPQTGPLSGIPQQLPVGLAGTYDGKRIPFFFVRFKERIPGESCYLKLK